MQYSLPKTIGDPDIDDDRIKALLENMVKSDLIARGGSPLPAIFQTSPAPLPA